MTEFVLDEQFDLKKNSHPATRWARSARDRKFLNKMFELILLFFNFSLISFLVIIFLSCVVAVCFNFLYYYTRFKSYKRQKRKRNLVWLYQFKCR
jgi:hypothetical protein